MSQDKEAIEFVKASKLFDVEWYLDKYPDVSLLSIDPVEHYFRIGARLGRDPSPNFSTLGYLKAHPDVEKNGLNPLYHYAKWGRDEGRLAPLSRSAGEVRHFPGTAATAAEESAAAQQSQPASPPEQIRQTEPTGPSRDELEQELAETKKKCQELAEENDLLLRQLHQVQEELEKYFLKYQELATQKDQFREP